MTTTITADTTHLVVDIPDGEDESLKPLALMRAVSSQLGGPLSLRLFRQSMLSGKLKLVSSRCHIQMLMLFLPILFTVHYLLPCVCPTQCCYNLVPVSAQ